MKTRTYSHDIRRTHIVLLTINRNNSKSNLSPYKGCYIQEHMVIVVMDLSWVGYVIRLIQFVSNILVVMASRAYNTVPFAQLEEAHPVNYDTHI